MFFSVFFSVFFRDCRKQSVFKIGWILRLQTATTFRDLGFENFEKKDKNKLLFDFFVCLSFM